MSCQKCGSTDTYCGCDEGTAIAERDAALAELAEVKKNMLRFSADGMRITRENTKADALELALSLIAERDAALAELAALKKRIADAPQTIAHVHRDGSMHGCFGQGGPDFGVCMVAIVRLTEEDV